MDGSRRSDCDAKHRNRQCRDWDQAGWTVLDTTQCGDRRAIMRSDRILLIDGGNGDVGCESVARSELFSKQMSYKDELKREDKRRRCPDNR